MVRRILIAVLVFGAGLVVGGWVFSRSLPRSILAVSDCGQTCYKPNELAGLLASVGIQRAAALIPTSGESSECIAIKHPSPEARVHFVLFPKRDVKNILLVQPEDGPFVMGCLALAAQLAQREGVSNYRLYSNGPALQHVTYLHFHLVAK